MDELTPMDCAVLFLVFNRPDTTGVVFEAIRQARPKRLYVAADGPRPSRSGEAQRCAETRAVATAVDWDCEVKTLFRDENLGCRRAVCSALDWFFSEEEYGVVLEDDCLPSQSWFPFAHEMLERFKDDERVMCIAANHFYGAQHPLEYSYFFSAYAHCWGWASWKRAWALYDRDMDAWPALRADRKFLDVVANGNHLVRRYWKRIFDMAYADRKVDSWAYRWLFSCWKHHGLTILPARNLVNNLGVGEMSTHTTTVSPVIAAAGNDELAFPLKHPPAVVRDVSSDDWESKYVFDIVWPRFAREILRGLPVLGPILGWGRRSLSSLRAKLSRT